MLGSLARSKSIITATERHGLSEKHGRQLIEAVQTREATQDSALKLRKKGHEKVI